MSHWETSDDCGQRLLAGALMHTAVHEAGHAIASLRLEIFSGDVAIARSNGNLGATQGNGALNINSREEAASHVLTCCAGYAALVAAGSDPGQAAGGCNDDFEAASKLIALWGLDGGLDAWKKSAVTLMRYRRNVVAVALVARQLAQRGRLDADYLGMLVNLADGSISQAEFNDYMNRRGSH